MSDEPHYDYDIPDADIIEEDVPQDLLTSDQARQATSDHDHEVAVATAKEAIRQRGILMKDLETALNMCRRYRGILKDNHFPDPNAAGLEMLLQKYGMTGTAGARRPQNFTPEQQDRIADLATGLRNALGDSSTAATQHEILHRYQVAGELTSGE